jgi:uncharacterized protein involved in outer membrane biogenesis
MKKFLVILTFIIVLLVGALVSVPFWLDVNEYKKEIAELIKDKTGFKVNIDGNITARAIPDISLVVENVSIGSSFDEAGELISTDKLVLNIKLVPLLEKKLEISSLQVIKPDITLQVNDSGQRNWETAESSKIPEAKDEVTEVTYDRKNSVNITDKFTLNELQIKDGSFKFHDKVKKQNIEISKINVTSSIKPGENDFRFSGKLNVFEDKNKGNIDLKGIYKIEDGAYHLKDLGVVLDDIKAHFESEADLTYAKPSVKASLYSNHININNYKLDIKSGENELNKAKKEEASSKEAFKWNDEKIDFSFLNEADISINLKVSGITYENIETGEVALNIYQKNNRLTINLKDTKFNDGIINSEIIVDNATELPTMKSKFTISQIDIDKLLKQLEQKEIFEGNADIEGRLYAAGTTQKEIVEKLSGKVSFEIMDGFIEGVNLFSMLKNNPDAFKVGKSDKKTRFEQISGDAEIKNGIVINENFVLKSDVLNFEGRGEIDLPKQEISYKLTPKYSQDFENKDNIKPRVPILISGNLFKPVFRLEVSTLVKDLINNPESGKNLVNQIKRDFKDIKNNMKGDGGLEGLKNIFQ